MSKTVSLNWPGGVVSGVLEGSGPSGILLAHGAGTNQTHPTMSALRSGLAGAGHSVLSFNYPYTERGGKRPDRQERLLECHLAVAEWFASETDSMIVAGRSMGGRMGSYLVADGLDCDGLAFYSYPLHPAGKPEKLRIEQFASIAIPMLFVQGTRDPLSKMDLFEEHIRPLPNATIDLLEGAAHGPRGGGWTVEKLTERYVESTGRWIRSL